MRVSLKQAETSFVAGMEEGRDAGLYLLELLCARDMKQFVVEKSQGQANEVDAMIEQLGFSFVDETHNPIYLDFMR